MACETPCVVTDVGDAAYIVSDTGWVVPPREPATLADAIELAIKESRESNWQNRCRTARAFIEKNFSIHSMVEAYQCLWREALNNRK